MCASAPAAEGWPAAGDGNCTRSYAAHGTRACVLVVHARSSAHSTAQKLYNWNTLNQKARARAEASKRHAQH